MPCDRTDFHLALRPFSLVVALATCSLGISLAERQGAVDPLAAVLVLLAGLLLQGGANLINDYPDLAHARFDDRHRAAIVRNARIGAAFITLACCIGLWFVWLRGLPMLALGAVGVAGAWSYADGPINFKARGLGVVAVFFLTGVLMIEGSFYALTGRFSLDVLWLSLPFSIYASLLLLANELRDFECDVADGHRTLSVRVGYHRGVALYRVLVLGLIVSTLFLSLRSGTLLLAAPLLALALLWLPLRLLAAPAEQRASLTQLTGRCYLAFSLVFVGVLWIPLP